MKHKFLLLYSWFVRTSLFFLPDMPIVMRFRGFMYGLGMKKYGGDFQVPHDVILRDLENISIGRNCIIGNGTNIMGSGTIVIEDKVLIGPNVIIISSNHTLGGDSFSGRSVAGTITICKGAWVAGNCTIQKDSFLPPLSVLSANSFLNKEFDNPESLYGGVPAKWIKSIKTAQE